MKKYYLLSLFILIIGSPISSYASVEEVKEPSKYEGITITVNVNSASAEELSALLTGVGKKKAQLIVDYREEFGSFMSVDDLTKVKGIGPALIEKNRTRIQL